MTPLGDPLRTAAGNKLGDPAGLYNIVTHKFMSTASQCFSTFRAAAKSTSGSFAQN